MSLQNLTEQRARIVSEIRDGNRAANWGHVDRYDAAIDRQRRTQFWSSAADPDFKPKTAHGSPEYRESYEHYLRQGENRLGADEKRALSMASGPAGAYAVLPEATSQQVLKALDNATPIRQFATKLTLGKAESMGVPVVDADPDDADWTAELGGGTEDSGLKFGKRELHPQQVIKRIRVSNKVLHRAQGSAELVASRLTYKVGITAEKSYLTGNGDKKPLGVFTASTSGISTGRDVATGNTSTSIGPDGLIRAMYSLKECYLNSPSLAWIFHRSAIQQIRLLKDGSNEQYLWQPALTAGQPDTILGVPVMLSEYAPSTFTTGLYVGLIGDLSYYWICDADTFNIQRLNELYALTDQTGFIARFETDGAPALEEAFARVTLG